MTALLELTFPTFTELLLARMRGEEKERGASQHISVAESNWSYACKAACTRPSPHHLCQQKSPLSGGSLKADDGTRTHDLLHGKQML
jgi:hypothetical protein